MPALLLRQQHRRWHTGLHPVLPTGNPIDAPLDPYILRPFTPEPLTHPNPDQGSQYFEELYYPVKYAEMVTLTLTLSLGL